DDYFIKDHLGNVRMVLTEEEKIDGYPELSFEGTAGQPEVKLQDGYWEDKTGATINVAAVRTARPGGFGTSGSNGTYVSSIKKSQGAIGAAKLLKVMAGDRIHTSIDYYYTAANTSNSGASGITSLLTNLASAIMGSPATGGILKDAAGDLTSVLSTNTVLASLLNTPNASSGSNQAPKAYLHVLFFNEQFKFDENASVVVPVSYTPGTKGTIAKLASNAVQAGKNGYVYVYFSNESEEIVFFDNFKLSHERGRILEETHYYAFGLTIAGISSKAVGIQPNQYLYNDGTELNESLDVGLYETEFRLYDPQIGRFWQVDELSDFFEDWSPYSFAFNNPIRYNDPHGLNPEDGSGGVEELEPVVVVGKRRSNYELYLERLRYGRQNGENGPKFYDTDGENLRARINWV